MKCHSRENWVCDELKILGSSGVSVYAVPINDHEFALFEGGIGRDSDLLLTQLAEHGIPLEAIRYWFVSHKHYDHCGMLPYVVPLMPNVEIVASAATIAAWQSASTRAVISRLNTDLGVPTLSTDCISLNAMPSRVLDLGVSFVAGAWLTVVTLAAPGHSPDHVCFYDFQRQRLFTGDCLGELDPATHQWRPLIFDHAAAYLETLNTLSRSPVRQIVTAHHGVLTPEGSENIVADCLEQTQQCIRKIRQTACSEQISEDLHRHWHELSATFVPKSLHRSSMKRMVDLILNMSPDTFDRCPASTTLA
ncbi:MBL fold metallo-hydrolase [Microbulbifer sp. HZ11]|uniref:MBL fold metallo-hydrolase n=1 Tax=unclassified Microbulbifer TaxID=2619833 RepID=UPI0005BC03C8|nr:MBL fold metallo-hydrolase [Microbulbifer sp. HZ11]